VTIARVRHVSKRYARQIALDEVTIDVQGGEIIGLIGPNGAGKTTLLRVVAGLVRPDSGRLALGVASLPGALRYFGGERTVPGDVSVRAWSALWGAATTEAPSGRLGRLSRGTRQRIGLDATLRSPAPSLVLLDEPWEGLDPHSSRWLSDSLLRLSRLGAAVIVSSHRIHDLAEVCSRCVFLRGGRLTSELALGGDPDQAAARASRLFQAFDPAGGVR
jgi:ABC-2 type transport system ATP-binding protein